MLIEKEVIRPGSYFYNDQKTGQPRKLVVTPEMTKHWLDQGNAMLSAGLTVPVPLEHDFSAHPMTPAERLTNNAGWVKGYKVKKVKNKDGTEVEALFSELDIPDPSVKSKLHGTIRWTSPWINSFTDGNGREWNNVISHLALTTRPRIVEQEPFGSVAAALSVAESVVGEDVGSGGYCLTNALRLSGDVPVYPMAFSVAAGIPLATTDKFGLDDDGDDDTANADDNPIPDDGDDTNDDVIDLAPFDDPAGDVSMTEVLSDLLGALGIVVEHDGDESTFKRAIYNAAMTKIHELTGKAQAKEEDGTNRTNPPGQPPNNPQPDKAQPGSPTKQPNPLIKQEQQPMYMSLEEINKLPDPMRGLALSLYNENQKIRQEAEADRKKLNSLNDAKLREEDGKRQQRVALLGRLAPRAKPMLDAMLVEPSMALSMGEGGRVVDPMSATLEVLEKGLADLPILMTTDQSALSVHQHPKDSDMMSDDKTDAISSVLARAMGCPPPRQAV